MIVPGLVCIAFGVRVLSWVDHESAYSMHLPSTWAKCGTWIEYQSAKLCQVGCLVPSFSSYFKPRNNSLQSGLMNHCKCLMCWQLHVTQLHTLFCCRNFKKGLEHCPPSKKSTSTALETDVCSPPPVYLYQAV